MDVRKRAQSGNKSSTFRGLRLERLENRELLSLNHLSFPVRGAALVSDLPQSEPVYSALIAAPAPATIPSGEAAGTVGGYYAVLPDLTGTWRGPMTETNPLGTTTYNMTLKITANPPWTNIFTGTMSDGNGSTSDFIGTLSKTGEIVINVDTPPGFMLFQLVGQLETKNCMAGTLTIMDTYGGTTTGDFTFIRGRLPDIVATSLRWDAVRGGANLSYRVTGTPLSQSTTADLYWATGPTRDEIIGSALTSPVFIPKTSPLDRTLNIHVAATRFAGDPPPEATCLVLVVNPDDTVIESQTANNVRALGLATDIKLRDATAAVANLSKISITYSISQGDLRGPFEFRAYLSTDFLFDESDILLPGKIDSPPGLKAGLNGTERVYKRSFTLTQKPPISDESRFIIVVADAGEKIPEVNEDNNAIFVIPIFAMNQNAGFDATSGNFRTGVREAAIVGAIGGRISRGTTEFDRLLGNPENNIRGVWEGNGRDFPARLRDGIPFEGDDWLVQQTVVPSLLNFVDLIDAAKADNRLKTSFLAITDSFDEQGDHSDASSHYEGRAIDFDADDGALGKLTGLAMLAGFDWICYEGSHVHVSQRGEQANVSADLMLAALDFGFQSEPKLIKSQARYDALRKSMADAKAAMDSNNQSQARVALQRFVNQALAGQSKGEILPGFAKGARTKEGFLRFNANRLAQQWGITLTGLAVK